MNIDWFTFGAQIINFIVLIWLLNRFLYEPITTAMQTRQETVAQRLHAAEEQRVAAEQEKQDFLSKSSNLETDRQQIFAAARNEAANVKQALLTEAQEEVHSRREDWLNSLEREKQSLITAVRTRAGQQVIAATRAALSELADSDLDERIVSRFLETMKNLDDGAWESMREDSRTGGRAVLKTAMEISGPWQQKLQTELERRVLNEVTFETDPKLVCGLELRIGGHKLGWNVQEYLSTLSEEIGLLMPLSLEKEK